MLVALSVLTALTGARTPVVWFKVCPVMAGAAGLLLAHQRRIGPGCQVCSTADKASRAAGTRA